jgi:DNA polymerase zeta
VPTHGNIVPDPNTDEIAAIFYSFQGSAFTVDSAQGFAHGKVIIENDKFNPQRLHGIQMDNVSDELELLNRIVDIVVDLDPDIIVGWEVQAASWGYLNSRGRQYGLPAYSHTQSQSYSY